jgi:uncharacterized BrkB/YihY/UPF0761 family membrane protein
LAWNSNPNIFQWKITMLNLKTLFSLLAVASLLLAAVCAVPFGIDLWNGFRAAGTRMTLSGVLNYRGVGGVLAGLVMFAFFVLLYRWRKN